jgi:hypothetical protein
MNVVWDIPRSDWPNFVFRRLRAALMLAILGLILVISTFASWIGSSGALPTVLLTVTGWAVSLLLNVVLYSLAFQVLTHPGESTSSCDRKPPRRVAGRGSGTGAGAPEGPMKRRPARWVAQPLGGGQM